MLITAKAEGPGLTTPPLGGGGVWRFRSRDDDENDKLADAAACTSCTGHTHPVHVLRERNFQRPRAGRDSVSEDFRTSLRQWISVLRMVDPEANPPEVSEANGHKRYITAVVAGLWPFVGARACIQMVATKRL